MSNQTAEKVILQNLLIFLFLHYNVLFYMILLLQSITSERTFLWLKRSYCSKWNDKWERQNVRAELIYLKQVWAETGCREEMLQDGPSVLCRLCCWQMQPLMSCTSSGAPGSYPLKTSTPHPEIYGMFVSHNIFTLTWRMRRYWQRISVVVMTARLQRKRIIF